MSTRAAVQRAPVDRAEELELVLAAQSTTGAARDRLVQRYMPLIGSVARTYVGTRNVSRTELMQEGVVGLLRALRRYDPELGASFWAYASWWVRQAMQQLVSEMARPIVLSDRALRQLARLRNAERGLTQELGREPLACELAEATGFNVEHVQALASAVRRPHALEERIGGDADDGVALGDRLSDPRAQDAYDAVPTRVACQQVPALLDVLNARERRIVRDRFGFNGRVRTLREVAAGLGVSAERVRQIEQESLEKCRAECGHEALA
jgi:RNA polymerase sigma factor (sigma-70 family)